MADVVARKGEAQAGTQSQAWVQIHVEDVIADDVANGLYSAQEGECVLAAYTEAGGRLSASIHVKGATGQDGVIGAQPEHGKGIRRPWHRPLLRVQFGVIVRTFEACGVRPPF